MTPRKELDLSGEPENSRLLELREFVTGLPLGETFALTFSDREFLPVVERWCDRAGHQIMASETSVAVASETQCYAMIRKSETVDG